MSRINTTTNTKLLPKVVDQILNSNVLATRMLSNAQKWSGEKIKKSIKTSKNTQGTSFAGMDTLGVSAVDTRTTLEFSPKFYSIPVVLPLTDISVNKSDEQRTIDLMSVEMASTAEDAADDIGTMFYGTGTGNGSKDFLGLEAIVDRQYQLSTVGSKLAFA